MAHTYKYEPDYDETPRDVKRMHRAAALRRKDREVEDWLDELVDKKRARGEPVAADRL